MVSRDEVPAAIEGSEMLAVGLDIKSVGRPKRLSATNEIVYPLTVKRNGKGTITQGLNSERPRFRDYSMLERDDRILGKNIWGFSSNFISPGDIVVGGQGRTGGHTGQELTITGSCFMELVEGWRGPPIDNHPQTILIE